MALRRFEINQRAPYADARAFGAAGAYEQIDGTAHFAVDPTHAANQCIVDLALAPRNADGLVEFAADLSIVMPVDSSKGNGRAIVELPNRGRRRVVAVLNRAPADAPVARHSHPGDGFLFERGFTVASIGWQWDVYRSDALMGLDAPCAMRDGVAVHGQSMVEIRPGERVDSWLLADRTHRPMPALAGAQPDAVLYVRDFEDGDDSVVARERWRFAKSTDAGVLEASAEHVHLEGGFDPGRIYQLVYETDHAPVAGLGLLALRDVAPFLRNTSTHNPSAGKFSAIIAWGVSQTGRMLREFMHLGLNQCEDGSMAYEGIAPHVAGARRGSFNHRFAQPSNQTTPLWGHAFPYADVSSTDALSARSAGLLDRLLANGVMPKVISTNSAAEYWRGDATLAHVDTSAEVDLAEHPHARSYLFASTQHVPGYRGQSRTNAAVHTTMRYPLNVLDYRPLLRAALVNLDLWISEGVEPPSSRHPRIADGSAVLRDEVLRYYATIPGFEPLSAARLPFVRTVDMGDEESVGVGRFPAREGPFYPALVSAIDADGNELAGIRLPDVVVPVASHAGWNPRDPSIGSTDQIVPMSGLTLFFAADEQQRKGNADPRPSIAQRYSSAADYEAQVRAVAQQLASERYLLAQDIDIVVAAAMERYTAAAAGDSA
ncbi:MAG: hypothetical protein ACI8W7_000531 [Gammaproteobacteria bacterium]|jgi:hypothetical protein